MLAAFVPDFGREQSDAERGELIKAVVQALTVLHGRAAGTVQAWQGAHRHELERRRNQEKYRGLLRTVVRAWREEADGRKAKTLRSVALRPGVEQGAHPADGRGHLVDDVLLAEGERAWRRRRAAARPAQGVAAT